MKLTPQTANTTKKILQLKRDNVSTKTHWMLVQGNIVTIVKQRNGEKSEYMVDIPKSVFNRFIKFYLGN